MSQNRSILFFGLAAFLALITSILAYNWFQNQAPAPQIKQVVTYEGTPIIVAGVDIPWGTPLKKELVKIVNFPSKHMPDGRFEKPEDVLGRIVLTPLKRHEPILESKLAPEDVKNGGVVGVLHPGMRAMAVRVNDIVGLPGFVKPGDRVDVMVTMGVPGKKGKVTKTVMENTLVLATGTQLERQGPGEKPRKVKVFTFEVSLEEAEKLAFASTEGKLRLALRSPLNAEPELTKGATSQTLLASFRSGKPSRAKSKPRSGNSMEIIIGGKRKFERF